MPDILQIAIKTAKKLEALKQERLAYLPMLETFIIDSNQNLDFSVIQKHSDLQIELNQLRLAFGNVKTKIFNLTKQGIAENANHCLPSE